MKQEFAGYQISRPMGGGGMTRLFVALDAQQNRYVIRVLDPVVAKDRRLRKQFFRGGEILEALQQPQRRADIVPYVKSGVEDGAPYMVLGYVESKSLRELIQYREPLLTDNVRILIKQLALALQYVHSRGFLHLDIKPENILVRPDGQLVLIDFDLALPKRRFFKRLSAVSGTAAYVAPESLLKRTADERSDIYAFGICCYEMLSFHRPYESDRLEQERVAQADPSVPPMPLRKRNPDVPPLLADLVMKCIAKDPKDRYPDMALVLRDLNQLR